MFLAVMILPDLLYRFLSEGLVSSASVPLFVELDERPNKLEAAMATIFFIALAGSGLLAAIMIVYAQECCQFFTPGFSQVNLERMKWLWQIISFYLVTGTLGGVLTSFLNARNIFALPAVGPLLVNASIIAGIFIVRGGAVEKIALAVVVGSFLQLGWLMFLIKKEGFKLSFFSLKDFNGKIALKFLKSIFPVAAWISVLPFIPVYERYLLSMEPVGSVAALNYIEKLFNLPLGILSISLARVILPELSRLEGNFRQKFLLKTLGLATLVIVPVVFAANIFSETIVAIVFKRGSFSQADTVVAAGLFASYSYALLPTTLCMLLNRGFFAARRYFIPFFAGLTAACTQFYLGRTLVERYGVRGIGYAAAAAFSAQLLVLLLAEYKGTLQTNKDLSVRE